MASRGASVPSRRSHILAPTNLGTVLNNPMPPTPFPSRLDATIQSIAHRRFHEHIETLTAKKHTYTKILRWSAFFCFTIPGIAFLVVFGILHYRISRAIQRHEERMKAAELRVEQTRHALEEMKILTPQEPKAPSCPMVYVALEKVALPGGSGDSHTSYHAVDPHYLIVAHAPVFSTERTDAPLFAPKIASWVGPAGFWEPKRITRNDFGVLEVEQGAITATSERALGSVDLPNVYVKKPIDIRDRRPGVITSGLIDTDERREQVRCIMQEVLKEKESVRISMHQLNSRFFGSIGEGHDIEKEHKQSRLLNDSFKKAFHTSPSVAHTNNALLLKRERPSREHNSQAYQTYLQWALEDFQANMAWVVQALRKKSLLSMEEKHLVSLLENPNIEALSKEILRQSSLRKIFLEQPLVASTKSFRLWDELAHSKTLSPSARVLLELAFDREVGALTHINCKSGLDRTGHIRALEDALSALIQEGTLDPEKNSEGYLEFLFHIDQHMEQWNDITRTATSIAEVEAFLKDSPSFTQCYRFQTCYWDSLQRVGLPITAACTGVFGFRWSQKADSDSLLSNPHPMPFLPLFARSDSRPKETLQVVRQGHHRVLTQEGELLLQGASTLERDVLSLERLF